MKIKKVKVRALLYMIAALCWGNLQNNANANANPNANATPPAPNTAITANLTGKYNNISERGNQNSPMQKVDSIFIPGLPKVESINIDYPLGVPELREGVALYEQYMLLKGGNPSKLTPTSAIKIEPKELQAIIFDFFNNIRIVKFPKEKKYAIGNRVDGTYEYYKLINSNE